MSDNRLPPSESEACSFGDDRFFKLLADAGLPGAAAPSRLKSRIFSKFVSLQAAEGTLMSLSECSQRGRQLCIFEKLVAIAPVGEDLKALNPCRVFHALIAGEKLEQAPIYWPGCPYVQFQQP